MLPINIKYNTKGLIVIRYFGGKSRISSQIADYINELGGVSLSNISEAKTELVNISQNTLTVHTHTHYVEPFVGSANVASKVNIENKILNDKNLYLIHMFKALQEGWIPPDKVSEEEYKLAKINQDKYPHVAGFIGFACSFAGKFWGGYARNSKGDNSGNYADIGKRSILKKMENLNNVEFTCNDFSKLDYNNCLIYADPPYRNTTPYYKSILGTFDYDKFLEWAKEQSKKNTVLVSEYKHNLPDGAKIVLEIPSKTSIRDKSGNVIETTEILFTYNNF